MKLRTYQSDFIAEIQTAMSPRDYVDKNGVERKAPGFKRICGYLPQGGGKSVVISFMALGASKKGNKVLILTHREEILGQNFKKMDALGLKPQIINAKTGGLRSNTSVVVAMSQTLASRCRENIDAPEKPWRQWIDLMRGFDFIIVDEPHRGEHDEVLRLVREGAYIVGLSASICRSGNGVAQLGEFYDCIVAGIGTPELIRLGYLTASRNFAFQAPKLSDIPINPTHGDYQQKQLQERFGQRERYSGVIMNYQKHTPGTKALVFTTGADHCVDLCMAFNQAGIPAKYLLSDVRPDTDTEFSGERKKLLQDFSLGLFKVLVNISILDTGYDEPSLETVILDFSTQSYTRYAQATGRGSRRHPGKQVFNVLDFGDNVSRWGIYEREAPPMSLWHNKTKGGVMMTKECPLQNKGCGRLVPISVQDCPYCQYHFPTNHEIYEVELQEIIKEQAEDMMTLEQWCAHKVLQGWSTNRILATICIKNNKTAKASFMEAIKVLRTKEGKPVSPNYWHFFKTKILKGKYEV